MVNWILDCKNSLSSQNQNKCSQYSTPRLSIIFYNFYTNCVSNFVWQKPHEQYYNTTYQNYKINVNLNYQ